MIPPRNHKPSWNAADKQLLSPIPRTQGRDLLGSKRGGKELPFTHGGDIWNSFELSWLNEKGKPQVAMGEFFFPHTSPYLIESKSFKLYLNSFCQTYWPSEAMVRQQLEDDLSSIADTPVVVRLHRDRWSPQEKLLAHAESLDELDISVDTYQVTPEWLQADAKWEVEETLYSHLLKSDCPATGWPDWGMVQIHYRGGKIDREGLLKYICSYRSHAGFAEHCVEEIFCDLYERCAPRFLTVYARYTRRGGLDINPFRSNFEAHLPNQPAFRQ